jgi:hypothetical protein
MLKRCRSSCCSLYRCRRVLLVFDAAYMKEYILRRAPYLQFDIALNSANTAIPVLPRTENESRTIPVCLSRVFIAQSLRHDAHGHLYGVLTALSARSVLLSHQLLWLLNSESAPSVEHGSSPEGNATGAATATAGPRQRDMSVSTLPSPITSMSAVESGGVVGEGRVISSDRCGIWR